MKKLRVLSLFDGISVAQQALKELGIECEYYSSEIDKYTISITRRNFPDTIQLGDIKSISYSNGVLFDQNGESQVGKIDLLVGGFPCTNLSIAKKNREGLAGSESGLFYEMIRIHKEIKPKWFVYENVFSMAKDQKEIITQEISAIAGRRIEPIMINASLISAQNRRRLFWTNITHIQQPEDRGIFLKDILESEVDEKYYTKMNLEKRIDYKVHKDFNAKSVPLRATDYKGTHNLIEQKKSNTIRTVGRGSGIDDKHNWDTIRIGQIGKGGQGDRIYSPEGKSVNLSANGGGRGAKTGLYAIPVALRNRGQGKKPEYNGTDKANAMTTVQTDSMVKIINGRRFQKETLDDGSLGDFVDVTDSIIRKLTPIECERLQSVPDNFTAKGINEKGEEVDISNSQRYKALGNAFNCEVIKNILKYMK